MKWWQWMIVLFAALVIASAGLWLDMQWVRWVGR